VLTPFVERLATSEEKKVGRISPELVNGTPGESQRLLTNELVGAA
jgi:hypothetical protein